MDEFSHAEKGLAPLEEKAWREGQKTAFDRASESISLDDAAQQAQQDAKDSSTLAQKAQQQADAASAYAQSAQQYAADVRAHAHKAHQDAVDAFVSARQAQADALKGQRDAADAGEEERRLKAAYRAAAQEVND